MLDVLGVIAIWQNLRSRMFEFDDRLKKVENRQIWISLAKVGLVVVIIYFYVRLWRV